MKTATIIIQDEKGEEIKHEIEYNTDSLILCKVGNSERPATQNDLLLARDTIQFALKEEGRTAILVYDHMIDIRVEKI